VPGSKVVRGVAIADLDADGLDDIGFDVGMSMSTVSVATWTATGLAASAELPMDLSVVPLLVGRLATTPGMVLAGVSNGPEFVHTFRLAQGTLSVEQTPMPAPGTGFPWEYRVATPVDIDDDGFDELLAYDPYPYADSGGLAPRLLKRSRGGWQVVGDELPALDFKDGAAAVAADVTGNGRLELVLSRDLGGGVRGAQRLGLDDYDPSRDELLAVAFENGLAVPLGSVASGTVAYELAAADFDDDGAIDIAAIGHDAVAMLRGRGNGTFDPPFLLALDVDYDAAGDAWGQRIGDGVAGDFDGDGDPELLLAAGAVGAPAPPYGDLVVVDDPLGAATLTVVAAGAVIASPTFDFLAGGDVNGDGVGDIVAATRVGETLGLFLLVSAP
jgi:hypothetical protein